MTSYATDNSNAMGIPLGSGKRQTTAAMVAAVAAAATLAGGWMVLAGFTVMGLAIAMMATVAFAMFKGNADKIVVGWVFLYPLGYYVLSYPRDRPVIQFDRLFILCLLVGILATPNSRVRRIPADMKRSALAWFVFLAAACISFLMAVKVITVGRMIVDNLLLPAILGWYVVRQFRLRGREKWLHSGVCVISIYCAAIGLAEVVLQKDLLAFQAGGDYYAYNATDPSEFVFLRPNGPFLANNSFAIVGLISFFLLAFLWTQIRSSAGPWRRVLHYVGAFAALLQANLPVFRSILLTLLVITFADVFLTSGFRRKLRIAALAAFPVTIILVGIMIPSVLADRESSENVSNRLSQDLQTWRIFIDHPVFGVGLINFTPTAMTHTRYQTDVNNVDPLNYPHNNLGWIACETGIVGLIPFLLAQVWLVIAFRRFAKQGERGKVAWRFFIFVFLSYWITGMTETAAYYGELNMWFVFAVALIYCYGLEGAPVNRPGSLVIAEGAAA